jgi:hypothetical protein
VSLTWKQNLPNAAGWYWMQGRGIYAPCIVEVVARRHALVIERPFALALAEMRIGYEWAGPLAEPVAAPVRPAYRYQLYGSYRAPKQHYWHNTEWLYDCAAAVSKAWAHVSATGDSIEVTLIIQERARGRWGRRIREKFMQGSSVAERRAHNSEAVGSIPAPASNSPSAEADSAPSVFKHGRVYQGFPDLGVRVLGLAGKVLR